MDQIANTIWDRKLRAFLIAGFHDPYILGEVPPDESSSQGHISKFFGDSESCVLPIQQYLENVGVVGAVPTSHGWSDIKSPGHITSVRGSPGRSLLHQLGRYLDLEPDLLSGHLILPYSFTPPTLPSSTRSSITVSMITIGCYAASQSAQDRVEEKQKAIDKKTKQYNRRLLERDTHGAEQCRNINLHGPRFFSVEQKVTFLPYLISGSSWSGLVMNDSGARGQSSPWISGVRGLSAPHFFPVAKLAPGALEDLCFPIEDPNLASAFQQPDPCQSRADLNDLMEDEHRALALEDPFVFVLDLLRTSSLCWIRFFGFLREVHGTLDGDEEYRADVFRHDKGVLDRSQLYFRGIIEVLDGRHRLGWPQCRETVDKDKVDRAAQDMRDDILSLQVEARALSDLCVEKMNVEMVTISILDSKRGLEQAARSHLLTILAYFFIPSAFISSVFGMNVITFTTPNPPISTFFATVIPFTTFFLILALWNELKAGLKTGYKWARQWYLS